MRQNLAFRLKMAKQKGERCAREHGFTALAVDPFAIAAKHDIEVGAKADVSEGVSGMLLRHGNAFGILYSTFIASEGFQRFSVAHELAHYFLEGHVDHVLPEDGMHVSEAGFTSGNPYELEADQFAAGLLMPSEFFKPALRRRPAGFATIEALSSLAHTSLTATAIRCAELSDDALAAIISTGPTVDFCFLSDAMKSLPQLTWIRKGTPVPADTVTARFNASRQRVLSAERDADDIDVTTWLGGNRHAKVTEEAIGLGGYGKTLTLLYSETLGQTGIDPSDEDEEKDLAESGRRASVVESRAFVIQEARASSSASSACAIGSLKQLALGRLDRIGVADTKSTTHRRKQPSTMSDENQHWVPKFLIKNFADSDGRVFCLDIHTDRVTKPPPRQAASQKGFNVFQAEGKTVSFEDRLEKFETRAAPVLKRIISERQLTALPAEDRRRVAEFIAAQSFRTKAFYEGLSVKLDRDAFAKKFSLLLDGIEILAAEIANRHWLLMVATGNDTFYLGDNPTVLQRTDSPRDSSNLGFDVTGVEAFLPLTPHCAIYMPCRTISEERIARYNAGLELHRVVRSAALRGQHGGSDELRLAQLVISRLDPLYQALTTGVALMAEPEHVENLNYLQCSWAHSTLYANRNDFTFARRVFRENPHYRDVPATTLIDMIAIVPDRTDRN